MPVDPKLVRDLFLEATDLPSADRQAYLNIRCAGDAELRAAIERLLAAHDEPASILEPKPGTDAEPTLLATLADRNSSVSESHATEILQTDGTIDSPNPHARTGGFVPGQVIGGRYTLLEVLGEGGMGTVYRAEQTVPVHRHVALKLIKVGMDSRTVLARFDAERQALAMMDHPNIARVYDGGATDANQPYFVMEFVHGVAITDYCDQHRLSVDARLQLFVAVCQAVQHAHQKGIIHRDIKPSNVMVTEVDGRATPKVIDFGVAKATESRLTDQTLGDTGAIVGTPTYMSPEQADPSTQDIDTRTDIYALGVILYELLAGSTPLDATQFQRGALLEMLRMVREVDPSKPSTKVSTADALPSIAANRGIDPEHLKRELRGDLDWIVMKALEKDRTRRYETANGLGADILRHLASEPVLAAPPSRSYRLRKFVRKHRSGVIAASLVLLALVAGVTGTTWGLIEARRQEALANERAEGERRATLKALKAAEGERLAKLDAQEKKAQAEENEKKALTAAEEERKAKETVEDVLGFVENKVFAAARPKGQEGGLGYDVKLVDAITAALTSIENSFLNKPLTEARLRETIGTSFRYLGKPEIAREQFEAAQSIYRRVLGPDHLTTLTSMNSLAISYSVLGRHAEALKLNEETLALTKARLGPDHHDTLRSMNNLANSYSALGRDAEALKLNEETQALTKARLGPDHPGTLVSMSNLAVSYSAVGRHAEALKLNEERLALTKAKLGPDHSDTLNSMHNLAVSYSNLGRYAEALKLNEETLALGKARLGPDHPHTIASMHCLAISYSGLGRHAEALKLNEETLALRKAKLGPDHPDTLMSMNNLALNYSAVGRYAEALKLNEETLALRKAKLGPDHPDTLTSMSNLANSYLRAGRTTEALSLIAKSSIANPKDTALSLKVAAWQAWFGQEKELAAMRQRILATAEGAEDVFMADRAAKACSILPSADRKELDAAIVLARRAVDLGKDHQYLPYFQMAQGMAEYRGGNFAEAEAALNAAMERGSGNLHIAGTSAFYRAMSLFRQGKIDEARKLAVEAASKMKPLPTEEQNPLAGGANADDLILWLAYKEAKALIGFETTPAVPANLSGK